MKKEWQKEIPSEEFLKIYDILFEGCTAYYSYKKDPTYKEMINRIRKKKVIYFFVCMFSPVLNRFKISCVASDIKTVKEVLKTEERTEKFKFIFHSPTYFSIPL